MTTMMKCGHAANATSGGKPACAICLSTEIDEDPPVLTGRVARCTYCKTERPSTDKLPFFEYCGEGSYEASMCGNCRYAKSAHEQDTTLGRINVVDRGDCEGYTPRGDRGYDRFYCGCKGWD